MSIGIATNDLSWFGGSGESKIKTCFQQVLFHNNQPPKRSSYKRKPGVKPREPLAPFDPAFKAIVEENRIVWPNNNDFNNSIKHLWNTYTDNVVTNLHTHANKHITQYLKVIVFQMNTNAAEGDEKFLPSDIDSVVKLIIKEEDIKISPRDPNKLHRCGVLYDIVNGLNVFSDIDLHDLTTDKAHWLKAMPMYLHMQRQVEEYNNVIWPEQRRLKRKKRKRKRKSAKKKQKWQRHKQMLDNPAFPPRIRNLVVIPTCDFRRKHIRIDCSTMHQVVSEVKLMTASRFILFEQRFL